jgi:hypothetical protein
MAYHGAIFDVDGRAEQYAAAEQEHIVALIEQGRFMAFPDVLRLSWPSRSPALVPAMVPRASRPRGHPEAGRLCCQLSWRVRSGNPSWVSTGAFSGGRPGAGSVPGASPRAITAGAVSRWIPAAA